MTLSYDYWKDREEKARQQTIKDEEERIKEIEEIYKRMFDEIQRDIDSFFAKYAADEGISISEAKKRVSKLDMEEFERKAKEYVKNKDFSDQANEEMKLYNLTMKVNRLEMLKAKIGLELVDGYQEIEDYMGEALTETTMKEIERHAGILGKTVGDNQDYAEDIVDASFHNATWSERIWANQDRLKHDLGKLLTSGLIQGKNPRELARDLQKSMNVSKYDAERLMRTEMCRVQIDASLREIEANGFTQFIFIADSGGSRTCEQCKALDGKTFALKDGKIGVNLPPLHPNCRCSIAGHEDDDDFINWLEEHGVVLTDDDLKAMGLSRKDAVVEKYFIYDKKGGIILEEERTKFDYSKYPHDEQGTIRATHTINHGLPKHLDPNSVYDVKSKKGDISRTFTDDNGNRVLRVDSSNHGQPSYHPMGEHKHFIELNNSGTDGYPYYLTDEDRKENADIL